MMLSGLGSRCFEDDVSTGLSVSMVHASLNLLKLGIQNLVVC
jgi:hypothetical protein